MITRRSAVVALSLTALPTGALAIVRRHDTPDSDYRADAASFPEVAAIGGVAGTLIAPQWIATAAHAFERLGDEPFSDWVAELNGERIAYDKVIIRPGRVREAVDSDYDVALLHLTRPSSARPVPLYQWDDEPGLEVTMVGRGSTGVGGSEDDLVRDGVLRRALNQVDAVFEHSLVILFDTPPRGLPLEGAPGPGDSGGPAYIERDGVRYLAGINSFNNGDSSNRYETMQGFARISGHRDWITQTIAADPASSIEPWSALQRQRSLAALPESIGAITRQFVEGLNSSTDDRLAAFYEAHGAISSRAPAERATVARGALAARPYRMIGFKTRSDGEIALLLRGHARQADLGLLLRLSTENPERIGALQSSEVARS